MEAQWRPQHIAHYEQEMLDWYSGSGKWAGTPFDPTHLVELARVKYAHAPVVAEALARCTRTWQKDAEYTSCSDPRSKNRSIGHISLPIPGGGCWLVDMQAQDVVLGFEWLASDPGGWVWQEPQSVEAAPAALAVVHRSRVPKPCTTSLPLKDRKGPTDSLQLA